MNAALPKNVAESIPDSLMADAIRWWTSLDNKEREELTQLCDSRRELFLFETFSANDAPKVTGGKFIPHDDAFGLDEWGEDYFQHLLDHPELMIVFDSEMRTFHIGCSRHREARRCMAEGVIESTFQCPFESSGCWMHRIRDNRRSVRMRPLYFPMLSHKSAT